MDALRNNMPTPTLDTAAQVKVGSSLGIATRKFMTAQTGAK